MQAGSSTHPAALQFFRAAANGPPRTLFTDGQGYASVVTWRPEVRFRPGGSPCNPRVSARNLVCQSLRLVLPEPSPHASRLHPRVRIAQGEPILTPLHNLCFAAAASLDEPHTAYVATPTRGIGRIDLREAPPTWNGRGGAHGLPPFGTPPECGHPRVDYGYASTDWRDTDILWLRADSHRIVGAGRSRIFVWDVRRGGAPVATADAYGGFEDMPNRSLKFIDLASRGRLVTTTFYTISGNQGLVALWDLSAAAGGSAAGSAGAAGVAGTAGAGGPGGEIATLHPAAIKLRMPRPVHTRSLLFARLIGRQTVLALTPSSEMFLWRVGSHGL